MDQYKNTSTQLLREEFWRQELRIRNSREKPKEDQSADSEYGDARLKLTSVAEELGKRYDDDVLYMDDKPWHCYL